jgi:hypothetical protein
MAGDLNIGYLRFGLGAGGEDFPFEGFDQGACFQAWTAKGLTAAVWLNLSLSQIEYEASLGSVHPLNVGINSFPPTRRSFLTRWRPRRRSMAWASVCRV